MYRCSATRDSSSIKTMEGTPSFIAIASRKARWNGTTVNVDVNLFYIHAYTSLYVSTATFFIVYIFE